MAAMEEETKGYVSSPGVIRWENELDRIFGEIISRTLRPFLDGRRRTPFSFGASSPAMDLYEEKNEVVVKAELPGIESGDVQIKFTNHQMSLKGEKKREGQLKEEDYYFSERSFGPFLRILDLPSNVKVDKARTSFKNGVMEIRLPKIEPAKKREIKIKVE